jgi:hypothetical protein
MAFHHNGQPWCRTCEKNFEVTLINLIDENYPTLLPNLRKCINYNLRSKYKTVIEILDNLREFQINVHSIHFHRLKIPNDLMSVCHLINTNRQIQYNYVLHPHPNIYAYVTNCMCCDECFAKKINPETRDSIYTNADYINSFLIKNRYEIVTMENGIIEYIKLHRPKEYITVSDTLAYMKAKDMLILVRDWPGISETYRKLFGIPIYLDGAVSPEHYNKFHSGYITDVIAGHPMASNGWMKEVMDDMEEMGYFV